MRNAIINLPTPGIDALAHSERLKAHIAAEIEQNGPMPFARFMQLALYAPGLGYYSAGATKLGEHGDFVTAPELSPLFSQCVARQCEQVLRAMPGAELLEVGGGTGVMALEILRELQRRDCLPKQYFILELSADLRERQQRLFSRQAPELLSWVQWLDRLPEQFSGVVLANEVLDAMPVHLVRKEGGRWQEYYVQSVEGRFAWRLGELSTTTVASELEGLPDLPEPYTTEVNLWQKPWLASLAAMLQSGVILLIDYGFPEHEYYHADRSMGTLMCHYQHLAHGDPLAFVGIQDITAHVNFTAVAQAAEDSGLSLGGVVNQAAFLMNCGLVDLIPSRSDLAEQMKINNQVKRLTLPSEMGELFKAMALTKNFSTELTGFTAMDMVHRL